MTIKTDVLVYNRERLYSRALWRAIQRKAGLEENAVDGIPGPVTAAAVADWQYAHDFEGTGCAGPITLNAMKLGPVRLLPDGAFCWRGGLAIDADGAPNAYNAADTGIDYLKNAGPADKPWGYVMGGTSPVIQGPNDPFPNHYVSTTALADKGYKVNDPRRYVDSRQVAYIARPRNLDDMLPTPSPGLSFAPHVAVWRDDHAVLALIADIGGRKTLDIQPTFGEGSIALAEKLGHDPYVKRNGLWRACNGLSKGVTYLVTPHVITLADVDWYRPLVEQAYAE